MNRSILLEGHIDRWVVFFYVLRHLITPAWQRKEGYLTSGRSLNVQISTNTSLIFLFCATQMLQTVQHKLNVVLCNNMFSLSIDRLMFVPKYGDFSLLTDCDRGAHEWIMDFTFLANLLQR